MGRADYYKPGTSNGLCQQCGFKFKTDELTLRWDGFYVCQECWEPRHPQDFVRGVRDLQVPAIRSPEPPDVFVEDYLRVTTSGDNRVTTNDDLREVK